MPGYVPAARVLGHLKLPGVSGHYASTPDAAALNIVGDMDIRLRFKPGTATGVEVLATKFVTAGDNRSWAVTLNNLVPEVNFNPTGAAGNPSITATAALQQVSQWFRVTLDVDNGASGHDVRFYTAPDQEAMPSVWTQLGDTVTTAGVTSIYAGTAIVAVGNTNVYNTQHYPTIFKRFQLRDGINGTVVADPTFEGPASDWTMNGLTSWDGYRVWTLVGTRWVWGS